MVKSLLHVAFMYHGARSGALRAPELAEQSGLALGRLLEASGKLWEASGALLGPLAAILNPLGALLEPSWSRPEASSSLETSWNPLGAILRPLGLAEQSGLAVGKLLEALLEPS